MGIELKCNFLEANSIGEIKNLKMEIWSFPDIYFGYKWKIYIPILVIEEKHSFIFYISKCLNRLVNSP